MEIGTLLRVQREIFGASGGNDLEARVGAQIESGFTTIEALRS